MIGIPFLDNEIYSFVLKPKIQWEKSRKQKKKITNHTYREETAANQIIRIFFYLYNYVISANTARIVIDRGRKQIAARNVLIAGFFSRYFV